MALKGCTGAMTRVLGGVREDVILLEWERRGCVLGNEREEEDEAGGDRPSRIGDDEWVESIQTESLRALSSLVLRI